MLRLNGRWHNYRTEEHKIFKNADEMLGWWDLNSVLMIWYFSVSTTLSLELKEKHAICYLKYSAVLMELH